MEGVWPTTLDAIDLSYDANDAIEEFGCTFRFNWMTVGGGGTSSEGGSRSVTITAGLSYSGEVG